MRTAWSVPQQTVTAGKQEVGLKYQASRDDAPFIHLVPKTFHENIEWRRRLLKKGKEPKFAQQLMVMCRKDILFWINSFVFIVEPRTSRILPFITYPFQDQTLLTIQKSIGSNDVGIEKSRDMGATWMVLCTFLHRWLFSRDNAFLICSRIGDLVDATGDPDTLFAKLDAVLSRLPSWMMPRYDRSLFRLANLDTNSVINGANTTGEIGRGGRRTAILLDELPAFRGSDGYLAMSASQPTTNTRVVVGTPSHIGAAGAFYDFIHKTKGSLVTFRLHWTIHPEKRRGLYTAVDGALKILDDDYWGIRKRGRGTYRFITDGKMRSPWYDHEEGRWNDSTVMAREHDIDYSAATYRFFGAEFVEAVQRRGDLRDPQLTGMIEVDPVTGELYGFRQESGGHLDLWLPINDLGRPASGQREFVVGADVAMGTAEGKQAGNSNSTLAVYDRTSGEQVAGFASASVDPIQFARIAVAVCNFFSGPDGNGAYLIWECTGPTGGAFGAEVMRLGYRNIYWRQDEQRLKRRPTDKPGWHASKDNKAIVFHNMRRQIIEGRATIRCAKTIAECEHFIHTDDNAIEFDESMVSNDPRSNRGSHGDRVVAHALAIKELHPAEEESFRRRINAAPSYDMYSVGGRRMLLGKPKEELSY